MITPDLEWSTVEQSYRRVDGSTGKGPHAMSAMVRDLREVAVPEAALSGMHRLAADMEQAAQDLAPWTDRSGDARRGLFGQAAQVGDTVVAALSHSVEYGKYLELNPKFAILARIMSLFSPKGSQYVADELELELRGRGSKFRHRGSGRFA